MPPNFRVKNCEMRKEHLVPLLEEQNPSQPSPAPKNAATSAKTAKSLSFIPASDQRLRQVPVHAMLATSQPVERDKTKATVLQSPPKSLAPPPFESAKRRAPTQMPRRPLQPPTAHSTTHYSTPPGSVTSPLPPATPPAPPAP